MKKKWDDMQIEAHGDGTQRWPTFAGDNGLNKSWPTTIIISIC